MKTPAHLLASAAIAAVFYPAFGWKAVLILAGGVAIDIDHYFLYILKYKKFGLRDCYDHFTSDAEKNNYKDVMGILLIFHTVEFAAAMAILSFYSQLALIFSIGLLGHYILDAIYISTVPKRIIINHSVISWIAKENSNRKIYIQARKRNGR